MTAIARCDLVVADLAQAAAEGVDEAGAQGRARQITRILTPRRQQRCHTVGYRLAGCLA
jgi:hypothetical protein